MTNTIPLTIPLDSLTQSHWSTQEKANVEVVVDFFQQLMNAHQFDYILQQYGSLPYTQHNRAIPNDIPGLVSYVQDMVRRFPDYAFDVKRISADGDYVVLHSHATLKAKHRGNENKGFIITDTFRLKNGQLVEHWDAIQPIDTFTRMLFLLIGGRVQNTNPTF